MPKGEVVRIRSANMKFSRIFYVRCASPICGVRIVAPIVLAQHKENERIGEALQIANRASPILY
jgi:hypothetical protein